jgi:hypothetical protein
MDFAHIVIDVTGGIGKNIASTAVVRNLKKKYPEAKIVVVAAWPRIFLNNPDVWRVYNHTEVRYFRNEYIGRPDVLFLKSEPYWHNDFISRKRHLIDVWCEQLDVPLVDPIAKLFITPREIEIYRNKWGLLKPNEPTLVIQTNGGMRGDYSWVRDVPAKQGLELIQKLSKHFRILHIRRQNQTEFQGVQSVMCEDIRELFVVVGLADQRLLIDSFSQHAAAALSRPSVVLWPVDNVVNLGYQTHKNILAQPASPDAQLPYGYMEEHNMEGPPSEFPWKNFDIFDIDQVVEAVLAGKSEKTKEVIHQEPMPTPSANPTAQELEQGLLS